MMVQPYHLPYVLKLAPKFSIFTLDSWPGIILCVLRRKPILY